MNVIIIITINKWRSSWSSSLSSSAAAAASSLSSSSSATPSSSHDHRYQHHQYDDHHCHYLRRYQDNPHHDHEHPPLTPPLSPPLFPAPLSNHQPSSSSSSSSSPSTRTTTAAATNNNNKAEMRIRLKRDQEKQDWPVASELVPFSVYNNAHDMIIRSDKWFHGTNGKKILHFKTRCLSSTSKKASSDKAAYLQHLQLLLQSHERRRDRRQMVRRPAGRESFLCSAGRSDPNKGPVAPLHPGSVAGGAADELQRFDLQQPLARHQRAGYLRRTRVQLGASLGRRFAMEVGRGGRVGLGNRAVLFGLDVEHYWLKRAAVESVSAENPGNKWGRVNANFLV